MTELPRHPKKSTEALGRLNAWYTREHAGVLRSETLTAAAKKARLEQLRKEYRERWFLAKQAAEQDLAEWGEIFEGRAAAAREPKRAQDKDARLEEALELQRLAARLELHKDQPGRLLAEYERALRSGNHLIAHELEDALPALLPEDARAEYERRAREERDKWLTEEDRKKLEEAEAFQRERASVELGLSMQQDHRSRGYVPGEVTENALVTHYRPGAPAPDTYEIKNPMHREGYEPDTNPGTFTEIGT